MRVTIEAAPAVTSVAFASAPASGDTYGEGESVEVAVTFAEPATVDISGGTPTIGLTVGTAPKTAGYVRGSGTRRLVFAYEVQASDTDADGVSVPANGLARMGGTIVNPDGAAFRLAHDALAADDGHKVDGAATGQTGGVCGRSKQVRDAIVTKVQRGDASVAGCWDVTAGHLQGLSGQLAVSNDPAVLKPGDFAGLRRVTSVSLFAADLEEIPDGVFDPLASVGLLNLNNNELRDLPAGLFRELGGLTERCCCGTTSCGRCPTGSSRR